MADNPELEDSTYPPLLTPLVNVSDKQQDVQDTLFEVVAGISPSEAASIDLNDPNALRTRIVPFLEEWAPDGWPFGINHDGDYGFWPIEGI